MGRAGSIHVFVQTDVGLPFYELTATTYPTNYPIAPPYIYNPVTSKRYVPIGRRIAWTGLAARRKVTRRAGVIPASSCY